MLIEHITLIYLTNDNKIKLIYVHCFADYIQESTVTNESKNPEDIHDDKDNGPQVGKFKLSVCGKQNFKCYESSNFE